MKIVIRYLSLILCLYSFGQNGSIEGSVVFNLDSSVLPGAMVTIGGTRLSTQTDIDGNFKFSRLKPGNYDLIYEYLGYGKDTIRNVTVKNNSTTEIKLRLPIRCYPKSDLKNCPTDGNTKNVIPIVYGLPTKRTLQKSKKGKVKLGSCEVNGCEPRWFCKEHNLEF